MKIKPILGATLGLQSVAVMANALKSIPKKRDSLKSSGKKIIRGGTNVIVGLGLLGPTAKIVSETSEI